MKVIMLKLVICEKVADDLMLAVTWACHTNQVIWQRLVDSSLPLSFPGPSSPASTYPNVSLGWTSGSCEQTWFKECNCVPNMFIDVKIQGRK